jgi:hypothetical protein
MLPFFNLRGGTSRDGQTTRSRPPLKPPIVAAPRAAPHSSYGLWLGHQKKSESQSITRAVTFPNAPGATGRDTVSVRPVRFR